MIYIITKTEKNMRKTFQYKKLANYLFRNRLNFAEHISF